MKHNIHLFARCLVLFVMLAGFAPSTRAMSESEANNLANQTLATLKAVTYTDLLSYLGLTNPTLSGTEMQNAFTAVKNSGDPEFASLDWYSGKSDWSASVKAKIGAQWAATYLDLEASFNEVKTNLERDLPRILMASDTSLYNGELIDYKNQILLGWTYLHRHFNFSVGEKTALDYLLYEQDKLIGAELKSPVILLEFFGLSTYYSNYRQANTATFFNTTFSDFLSYESIKTSVTTLPELIDALATCDGTYADGDTLLRSVSSAVIADAHAGIVTAAHQHDDFSKYLLPLLNLKTQGLYAVSVPHNLTFGLTSTYTANVDDAFRQTLTRCAERQNNFMTLVTHFFQNPEALKDHPVVTIDTLATNLYVQGSSSRLNWSPIDGDPAVRDFIAPLGHYHTFQWVGAQNMDNVICNYMDKALSDTGIATFTHENTHTYLANGLWLDGHTQRANTGSEFLTRGVFETVNPDNGEDALGLNLAFSGDPDNTLRLQNADYTRLTNRTDVAAYMRGVMDVTYTLELLEAEALLAKESADLQKALRKITTIQDPNTASQTIDLVEELSADEVSTLKSIDDFVTQGLVASRLSTTSFDWGTYASVGASDSYWTGAACTQPASGYILFKRIGFEFLAEYGWTNGFIPWVSDAVGATDAEVLASILADTGYATLADFKKAMYARRLADLPRLKPTEHHASVAALRAAMSAAVETDLAQTFDLPSLANGSQTSAVATLRKQVLNDYLRMTDDFKTSIYTDETPSEPEENGSIETVDEETIRVKGGTAAAPIVVTFDNTDDTLYKKILVAANSFVRIHRVGGNCIYDVTGEDSSSHVYLTGTKNWGMTADGSRFTNLTLDVPATYTAENGTTQNNCELWIRCGATDESVHLIVNKRVVLEGEKTTLTLASLAGSGNISSHGSSRTIAIHATSEARYTGVLENGDTIFITINLVTRDSTIRFGDMAASWCSIIGEGTAFFNGDYLFGISGSFSNVLASRVVVGTGATLTIRSWREYALEAPSLVVEGTLQNDTDTQGTTRATLNVDADHLVSGSGKITLATTVAADGVIDLSSGALTLGADVQLDDATRVKLADGTIITLGAATPVAQGLAPATAEASGNAPFTLTVANIQPGFYYAVRYGARLNEMTQQTTFQSATQGGTLELDAPAPEAQATCGFYRIIARPYQ